MSTTSFIFMLVALVLLIIAIGRVQGSPKTSVNLLFALAFGVVVGLGIQSKNNSCTLSKKDTKIEKVSLIKESPMQALQAIVVTPIAIVKNKFAGKVSNSLIKESIGDLQQIESNPLFVHIRADPAYEDSS